MAADRDLRVHLPDPPPVPAAARERGVSAALSRFDAAADRLVTVATILDRIRDAAG